MTLDPSKSEFLNIDRFELDTTWDAVPTDSQEQLCVREPVVVRPLQEVRAMTARIELEGADALGWEVSDDGDDYGDKGAPSPCSASAAMVAAGSAAQLTDIMSTQVFDRQYLKSQAGLDMDGDISTPMDVEPSNSIKGMLTPEGTQVTEVRSVMPRGQDDQEHEINDIIGKEEVNGEAYYWVDWTLTLMPLSELGKASDLVGKFETGLPAHRRHAKGQRKQLKSDRGRQTVANAAFAPEKPPRLLQLLVAIKQAQHGIPAVIQKPRRGRPRKQK